MTVGYKLGYSSLGFKHKRCELHSNFYNSTLLGHKTNFGILLTCINCNKCVVYILFLVFSRGLWCPGSVQEQVVSLQALLLAK